MPGISNVQKVKKDVGNRPASHTSERAPSANSIIDRNLRKSLSYQNLKTPTATKLTAASNETQTNKAAKRPIPIRQKYHGSAANLPAVCAEKPGNSGPETQFQSHLTTFNGQKSRCNAHRISVNSDLLSRVEKEKKQYEARISELTQVTETRKMEIEKLTFEIRRAKEETANALSVIEEVRQENMLLRSQLCCSETSCTKDGDQMMPLDSVQLSKSQGASANTIFRKPASVTHSPPESLGTTTRLTPGGATTNVTGTVTASSFSGDWNEPTLSLELTSALDYGPDYHLGLHAGREVTNQPTQASLSVATLQGRLLQMEEANYTTNEELQATLQELWDMQRSVDEAHEETHNLAFERAILLEALSTQTSKLEHCRFQIEQLKHLLLTDRRAQTLGSRENHFCELYASIEHEKQVLLSQNNDLAQSSDSLARECRILTEKAAQLQDSFDSLQAEHATLKAAYQDSVIECNALKGRENLAVDKQEREMATDSRGQASESPGDQRKSKTPSTVCSVCGADEVGRLQLELLNLRKEYNEVTEKLELVQAERERETTEWRLYERDLLKTVQIADGIKSESEAEASRLSKENESLKSQMEVLTKESASLSNELKILKEKWSSLSILELPPSKSISHRTLGTSVDESGRSAISTCSAVIRSGDNSNPALYQSTLLPNELSTSRVTSVSDTHTSLAGRVAAMNSNYSHHRPSVYGNAAAAAAAAHLHFYSGSPGAPVRPSCLNTNGPTVRNLIQSIENQVKAVQHQKRGLSSNPSNTLPVTSTSSSLHLYSSSTVCKSNSLSTNNTTNGGVRSRASACLGLASPTNQPVNSKLRSPASVNVVSSNFCDKENVSAPGGPGSGPPVSPGCDPKLASAPSAADSEDTGVRSRNSMSAKLKLADSVITRCTGPVSYTQRYDSSETSTVSPPRVSLASQTTDINSTTTSSHHPISAGSRHASLERPTSPPSSLPESGTTNTRRFSSTENTNVKKHGTLRLSDQSDKPSPPKSVAPPQQPSSPPESTSVTNTAYPSIHHFWQDPLQELARRTQAGSKRNALLLWCQSRVAGYRGVEVTNFSSSWNNGLALCALLHTFTPSEIAWNDLVNANGLPVDKRRCFEIAFKVAENAGIPTTLRLQDMLTTDRPDWNAVMSYVTSIYRRFEVAPTLVNHATQGPATIPPNAPNTIT
ncbi:hypothetical protein AHF37_03557 [Paragonimus kellicotti]|nr:hypothetical protein AHF37_03557 [Paragonimus kellicotti]